MTHNLRNLLLVIAVFGLFVPNGMFIYYIVVQFSSISGVLNDLLTLGFIIDACMATGLIAWWLSKNSIGKYTWKMFVLLSLIGGLGFSLPFFYNLNTKEQ